MSQYIYAIIPYESGISFSKDEPYPCVWEPILPELKDIHSEFTDDLCVFKDFLMINTCYRQSAFTDNRDGFCRIRADVCIRSVVCRRTDNGRNGWMGLFFRQLD